jgi:hypothetical protein
VIFDTSPLLQGKLRSTIFLSLHFGDFDIELFPIDATEEEAAYSGFIEAEILDWRCQFSVGGDCTRFGGW